jgi:hypothetical protein
MSSFFQSFDLKLRCFVEENYISLKDGDSENENFEDKTPFCTKYPILMYL